MRNLGDRYGWSTTQRRWYGCLVGYIGATIASFFWVHPDNMGHFLVANVIALTVLVVILWLVTVLARRRQRASLTSER